MEARVLTVSLVLAAVASLGANYRSENFVVTASTEDVARQVAETAEECRKRLAVEWLGEELRPWYHPCPINVRDGAMGAGGWTKFTFVPYNNEIHVNNWDMKVQGTVERILDSVIPHEVTHTILATHFRRPLPRWADEGASTLAEHEEERLRQVRTLQQVLRANQAIPLRTLLDIKDYPEDMQKVYTLYAQGYSLSDMLVQQGGRGKFLKFLQTAHKQRGWDEAVRTLYGYSGVSDLESRWKEWVLAGSPDLTKPAATEGPAELAQKKPSPARRTASRTSEARAQSPDEDPFLEAESERAAKPLARSPSKSASKTLPVSEPQRYADAARARTATRSDVNVDVDPGPGEDLPGYAAEDQPAEESPQVGEDDTWDLELIPASVTQSTTRRSRQSQADGEIATENSKGMSIVRSSGPEKNRPPRPFRRQSEVPPE